MEFGDEKKREFGNETKNHSLVGSTIFSAHQIFYTVGCEWTAL